MSHAACHHRRRPLWLWPIVLLWRLVTGIAKVTGIVVALAVGSVLMLTGYLLTGTIIGAIIGLPLFFLGFLLVLRALY